MKRKIKIYTLFLAFMMLTTGLRYFHIHVFHFGWGEFSPILISVIFILLNRKDSFKMLSFNRFELKPLLLPILAIIFVVAIDFIVQVRFQLIQQPVVDMSFLINLAIFSVIFTIFIGGFEEIGWRGYLTSKIIQYKLSWNQLIIITSIIWSIWHLPSHYSKFEHLYVQYPLFIISCFELSIIMAYLRIRTNSVITAIILHSLIALLSYDFFKPTSHSMDLYFLTFPSIVMILLLLPVSVYYYKRGSKIYLDKLKTE
ncbi:MAG: CPBP family intramembrane metalloprotease [Ignavibacteriaceae bacterium]|nr:CPBP family intramembrane metalloprotease [Ignavibacteriaceae bacterium]